MKLYYKTDVFLLRWVMHLNIVSFNCWLLPPPFSTSNTSRLSQMTKELSQLNTDVILLQEVWLNIYKTGFEKLLSPEYASPIEGVYNKTGLITLSRARPIARSLHLFDTHFNLNLVEMLARKGFERLEFDDYVLINTHLYDPLVTREQKIVKNQLAKLKAAVLAETKPTLVVGDFNSYPTKTRAFLGNSFRAPEITEYTLDRTNPYAQKLFNKFGTKSGIIDQLFVYPAGKQVTASAKVLSKIVLSDHYPVEYKVTIN